MTRGGNYPAWIKLNPALSTFSDQLARQRDSFYLSPRSQRDFGWLKNAVTPPPPVGPPTRTPPPPNAMEMFLCNIEDPAWKIFQ